MAKTLELAFQLAGKMLPSFASATKDATGQFSAIEEKTKRISAAAQKRQDGAMFKALSKNASDTGKSFGNLRREITGTALIITGTAAAFAGAAYGIAKSSAASADAAIKNAQSIGMATTSYTEMAYAARMSNVAESDFVNSSARLNKLVKDALGGNQSAIDAFKRAGVALRNENGELKNTEQLWLDVSDAFASMPDGIGKTALAMDIFGKSGTKLIPMLNGGRDAINALRDDARRLGVSLSETDAMNAEAFNDSFANIGESIRGVSLTLGKVMWPALTNVHKAISSWISANGALLAQKLPEWISHIEKQLPELEAQLSAAWASVQQGAAWVNNLVQGMGGWVPVIEKVVKWWLYYRALRVGVALGKTTLGVVSLTRQFYKTIPAIGRWVGEHKKGLKTVGSAFAKAGSGIARTSSSVVAALGRWKGTFGLVMEAVKDYTKSAAVGMARFAKTVAFGTVSAAKFAWTMSVAAVKGIASFAVSLASAAVGGITAFASAMWAATAAVAKFTVALLLNPVGAIIAGLVALGAAAYLVYKNWDTVSDWLTTAWDYWSEAAGKAFDAIADAAVTSWGLVEKGFAAGWALLPGEWQNALTSMANRVVGWGEQAGEAFLFAWDSISAFFGERIEQVKGAFSDGFINGLSEAIRLFNPTVLFQGAFTGLVNWLAGYDIVSAGLDMAERFGQALLSGLGSLKSQVVAAITDMIPGGEFIANTVGSATAGVKDAAGWVGNKLAAISPFAQGGIVTAPQVGLVGEDGPEMIVPLSKPDRARDLMGTAAGMLGLAGSSETPIWSVTLSPSITIEGDASESTVTQMEAMMQRLLAEVMRRLEEAQHNKRRTAAW